MNTLVIENVQASELPPTWRARLRVKPTTRLRVRIEPESVASASPATVTQNPLFGMWRDRDDIGEVEAYVRQLRTAVRGEPTGSRRKAR